MLENKSFNIDGLNNLASALLREYVVEELKKMGLNPACLETTIKLVEKPDNHQMAYELLKSKETEKVLLKRLRESYALQAVQQKEIQKLKVDIKNSKKYPQNMIEEAFNILDDLVHIDPNQSTFIEELKQTQNNASWLVNKYGFAVEEE